MFRLTPWRKSLCGIAFLEAIYYALAGAGAVPYAEVCSQPVQAQHRDCTLYDIQSAFIGRLFVFLDEHNGALTALAGIAVAAFTFTLWQSTEKLWAEAQQQRRDGRRAVLANIAAARAARKSADVAEKSLLAAHRPLIVISPLFLVQSKNVLKPYVEFVLQNSGKGVAIILKVGVTAIVYGDDNVAITDDKVIDVAAALEPSEKWGPHQFNSRLLTRDIVSEINGGSKKLSLMFRFEIQDIFKNPTFPVFALDYDRNSGQFTRSAGTRNSDSETDAE